VSQPRYPLRINVGFLFNQPIGTYREIHFDFPNLQLPPDVELYDFAGVVRISRTPQGLIFEGDFKAKKVEQCVRCLADFLQPLRTEFDELYAFSDRSVSDSGLILPEDANVDLAPLVREYLLLEVPISPQCKPDCKGLCPVCGEDQNQTTCEHVIVENKE
jgi:uncharacterized protein